MTVSAGSKRNIEKRLAAANYQKVNRVIQERLDNNLPLYSYRVLFMA